MGKTILEFLEGEKIYICQNCNIQLSSRELRVSKQFTGQSGQAYLFSSGINYYAESPQEKMLRTGKHITSDIKCCRCHKYIGWKYIKAYESSEKYKEGKIILERAYLLKSKW